MGIPGYDTLFEAASDSGQALANPESMSDVGAAEFESSGRIFQIDDASRHLLDWTATFTVELDTGSGFNTVSPSDYTIRYLIGAVEISTASSGDTARISGQYLSRYQVAQARGGAITLSDEELDETVYTMGARARRQGLRDVTVEWEQLQIEETPLDGPGGTEDTWEDIFFQQGRPVVLRFDLTNNGSFPFACIVDLFEESIEPPVADLATKNFSGSASIQQPAMASQKMFAFDILPQ